jgi:Uncharacterized protein conserved in bacteria
LHQKVKIIFEARRALELAESELSMKEVKNRSRTGAKTQRKGVKKKNGETLLAFFAPSLPTSACAGNFLLVVCLLFTTNTSSAHLLHQTQDEAARAAAQQLYDEGERLLAEKTAASRQVALKKFEQAVPLWQKAGDKRSQAITLGYIGYIYKTLDQQQRAIDYYKQALPLLQTDADKDARAATLNNIGKAYDVLGDKQQAIDYYNRALLLLQQLGEKDPEAATLNNIGLAYHDIGEKQKALEAYNRALSILRATKNLRTEAITLVNIGLVYENTGEKQKALNHYQQALAIFRAAGERGLEGVTLNNIGLAYHRLGESKQALDYFALALTISREGDRQLEAVTLNNIGYVYDTLEERQKALEYYNFALPVLRDLGDRFKEAMTLNNLGLMQHGLGQHERALDFFAQALKLRQATGDRPGEAETLSDRGMVYAALGDVQKALDSYNAALSLSRAVEDRRVEASTLRRLALLEQQRGNLPAAREKMEEAISIIEAVRTKLATQELRASYFASVYDHFETYISILMGLHKQQPARGYDALALSASERGRARSMLEMLIEARADIRQGIDPALLERERKLQQQITLIAEQRTRLLNEKRAASDEAVVLQKELEKVLDQYQQTEAEIRIASPRYAALTQPVPSSLREIQQQALDADTVLLEYALGDKKSYLWMVTPNAIKSFELPARAEIQRATGEVTQLLTARNLRIRFETAEEREQRVSQADKDYVRAAANLSRMLLGPIASGLQKQRLLIVSDGDLNYIPFAALPVPTTVANAASPDSFTPLIVNHEIVTLPSASTLVTLRKELAGRKPAPKTLAVIADPVFDKWDERVRAGTNGKGGATRGLNESLNAHPGKEFSASISAQQANAAMPQQQQSANLQRIPYTREEADRIMKFVPLAQSKKALLDFDASRQTAVSRELGQYRYVHFATHGILNPEHPELSGIVLSLVNRQGAAQEGFLGAHQVFNLRLPVEMVVLSGCRTGLGKDIKGEGLVGLTRGFMYAGAARVVVSLWDVSDEGSAELMAELYKGLLKEHLPPAAALRNAQIALWREKRWEAPYYWAAFVLQGEPR